MLKVSVFGFVHRVAADVAGHQVGRELHARDSRSPAPAPAPAPAASCPGPARLRSARGRRRAARSGSGRALPSWPMKALPTSSRTAFARSASASPVIGGWHAVWRRVRRSWCDGSSLIVGFCNRIRVAMRVRKAAWSLATGAAGRRGSRCGQALKRSAMQRNCGSPSSAAACGSRRRRRAGRRRARRRAAGARSRSGRVLAAGDDVLEQRTALAAGAGSSGPKRCMRRHSQASSASSSGSQAIQLCCSSVPTAKASARHRPGARCRRGSSAASNWRVSATCGTSLSCRW